MRARCWLLVVLFVALGVPMAGANGQSEQGTLFDLLAYVPDTAANRDFVVLGDVGTWHTSWGVPRIDSLDEWDGLPRVPRAYWLSILPRQVVLPELLGANSIEALEGIREYAGFDLFGVDRFVSGGEPPDDFTVAMFNALDGEAVDAALRASGYEAQPVDDTGAWLYHILEDYEMGFGGDVELPRFAVMGQLNRILVDGEAVIVARATDNALGALATSRGEWASLADRPAFIAAGQAVMLNALDDTGDLVGALFMDGLQFLADPFGVDQVLNPEQAAAQRQHWGLDEFPLPPFELAVFATRHAPEASYLILGLVYLDQATAEAAAASLAGRLPRYGGLLEMQRRSLTEFWAFDRTLVAEVGDRHVALAVMRVDDPPLPAEDEGLVNAAVLSWYELILRRDLGFLAVNPER